jgi:hypothetical protein
MKKALIIITLFCLFLGCEKEPLVLLNPSVDIYLKEVGGPWIYFIVDINSNPTSNFNEKYNPNDLVVTCTAKARAKDKDGELDVRYATGPGSNTSISGTYSFDSKNDFNPKYGLTVAMHDPYHAYYIDYATLIVSIEGYFSIGDKKYSFYKLIDDL